MFDKISSSRLDFMVRSIDTNTGTEYSWHNIKYIPTWNDPEEMDSSLIWETIPDGYIPFKLTYMPDNNTDPNLTVGNIYGIPATMLSGYNGYTNDIYNINDKTEFLVLEFSSYDGTWASVPSVMVVEGTGWKSPIDDIVDREYKKRNNESFEWWSNIFTNWYSLFPNIYSTLSNQTNVKIDNTNELLSGLRGAIIDIKNQPEDACIIRIYVGDQTKKREAAAREIERLLGEGYRPYQTFGISEDLARVLFVKYPEPNDANVAP